MLRRASRYTAPPARLEVTSSLVITETVINMEGYWTDGELPA